MKTVRTMLLIALAMSLPACGKIGSSTVTAKETNAAGASQEAASAPVSQNASGLSPQQTDAVLNATPKINPERAWQYTKEIAAVGSRPLGSPGHKKIEDYIHSHLKGDQVEDDAFVQQTPVGAFPVRNIVAKFPGKQPGIIVVGSHYETNYPLPKSYVGANDGGSSTALLLEFANLLRQQEKNGPMDGHSVWLVFTDGEEAMELKWSNDSLYGSKHLAEKWSQDGTLKNVKAFLLADMLGDSDLNLEDDGNSSPQLRRIAYTAAEHYGYQSHMFGRQTTIQDDHIPFKEAGVPVMDFIDLNYGYNNAYHHTPEDTIDKLSPKSLQISGDVILGTVALLNAGAK
jgi:glutaminyl-peptide cyclotransferase